VSSNGGDLETGEAGVDHAARSGFGSENHSGHGLGLSIVQNMVAQRDVNLILNNLPNGD
jgi:K+-sensing histidine kinase KdpD